MPESNPETDFKTKLARTTAAPPIKQAQPGHTSTLPCRSFCLALKSVSYHDQEQFIRGTRGEKFKDLVSDQVIM